MTQIVAGVESLRDVPRRNSNAPPSGERAGASSATLVKVIEPAGRRRGARHRGRSWARRRHEYGVGIPPDLHLAPERREGGVTTRNQQREREEQRRER